MKHATIKINLKIIMLSEDDIYHSIYIKYQDTQIDGIRKHISDCLEQRI